MVRVFREVLSGYWRGANNLPFGCMYQEFMCPSEHLSIMCAPASHTALNMYGNRVLTFSMEQQENRVMRKHQLNIHGK